MGIDAGEFSEWVNSFLGAMKGESPGNVPCGNCVGCCTSSKFVLVKPSDSKAKSVIPKELLFSAPGLPKGFQLMGYDEEGHCPMFRGNKCSIYESRPETCRQYDCRVLTATGADIDDESEIIKERVVSWEFSFNNFESKNMSCAIKRSMEFLKENSVTFPKGYVPHTDSQIAALAIRIHSEFDNSNSDAIRNNELVQRITNKYPISSST